GWSSSWGLVQSATRPSHWRSSQRWSGIVDIALIRAPDASWSGSPTHVSAGRPSHVCIIASYGSSAARETATPEGTAMAPVARHVARPRADPERSGRERHGVLVGDHPAAVAAVGDGGGELRSERR